MPQNSTVYSHMGSHDNRFYPRLSYIAATGGTPDNPVVCPQPVLDQLKPIKSHEEVSETGDIITPTVYYTEEDGLTIVEAADKCGVPVRYFIEAPGEKPKMVQGDENPTTVLLVLPPLLPTALEPFFMLARALGANPNHTLLYAGISYEKWLNSGILPKV